MTAPTNPAWGRVPRRAQRRWPSIPPTVQPLADGEHDASLGGAFVRVAEDGRHAAVRFVVAAEGRAALAQIVLLGGPEERAVRDLALLARLLSAGGRRVQDSGPAGIARALSGLRARLRLRAFARGFVAIEEVLP